MHEHSHDVDLLRPMRRRVTQHGYGAPGTVERAIETTPAVMLAGAGVAHVAGCQWRERERFDHEDLGTTGLPHHDRAIGRHHARSLCDRARVVNVCRRGRQSSPVA